MRLVHEYLYNEIALYQQQRKSYCPAQVVFCLSTILGNRENISLVFINPELGVTSQMENSFFLNKWFNSINWSSLS